MLVRLLAIASGTGTCGEEVLPAKLRLTRLSETSGHADDGAVLVLSLGQMEVATRSHTYRTSCIGKYQYLHVARLSCTRMSVYLP